MGGERQALLDRLRAFPARLGDAARRTDAADDSRGLPPGEWSSRETAGHLVSVETRVWQARLDQLAAGGPEPAWTWTEPGPVDDPEAATLEGALGLFAVERARTLDRIATLGETGWARTGLHATYGRLDVAGLLRVAADHDEEHLAGLEARSSI